MLHSKDTYDATKAKSGGLSELTCVIKSNPKKTSHAFMALSVLKSIPSGTGGEGVVGDVGVGEGVG